MSMHLHHPSLSMSGKKKGKVKFRNAEEARKSRDLDESWKLIQKKWNISDNGKNHKKVGEREPLVYSLNIPAGRSTRHIPLLGNEIGSTAPANTKIYSGTEMSGIGQLHKSNAVPVSSQNDAVDISKMRR